jgi:hypothetical protein
MNGEQFIHVLQAAAGVVDDELVVVGSQAILASVDDPPNELVRSTELDVYPLRDPRRAIEIDRNIGEGSRFHQTFGYYAHGVGPETIVAPAGWQARLIRFEAAPIRRKAAVAVGWCLSLEDLMLAKLAAGRPHDLDFVEESLRADLVSVEELERGVDLMPRAYRERTHERLDGLAAKIRRRG